MEFSPEQLHLYEIIKDGSQYIKQLSCDCVIFGFHDRKLKVLLLKVKGIADSWITPGGHIFKHEGIQQAAERVLFDKTGLTNIFLEQFYVFGSEKRETGKAVRKVKEANGFPIDPDLWIYDRFVSIGYYALVDFTQLKTSLYPQHEAQYWFDINELPNVILDHAEIIQKAIETLRLMLDYKLVGFNLLPEAFTMQELQDLYETVLNKKFRRDNFQRKMLSMSILERLEKKLTGKAHKAPYFYRFKK